ncbi:hypothetical protein [Anaeroselena agilis]|uniref:Phage protein n=1 Tax=Anaeroselena agilis TaxID=3063788 RepID=A0ABU3P262_9FIRM|nr:hypothetical protein [Selenomonadales bacterium 4137-cl]
MEFIIKTPEGEPAAVAEITPEIIAKQRVGSRIEFKAPHDLTVEFAGGACVVDDIDLIVYIVPDEFFCYRGDDYVLKFVMACRSVLIDHRPPLGAVNARAIISVAE